MSVMDQAIIKDATNSDQTVQRIAPIRSSDRDLLSTPKCPESCFRQMEQDLNSRCTPVQPVPAGVEGDGQRRRMPPHRVSSWNRERDADFRRMEDIARDGLQVANLQSFVMAHLLVALTDESYAMGQSDRVQTVETLRELQHMSTRHFSTIAAQSLIARRACAAEALNFPDRRVLTGAPVGASLFGDDWERLLSEELARRQVAPPAPRKARKRKRRPLGPPAPPAPYAGAVPAPRSGRGDRRGRGSQGFAPATRGAPAPQQWTAQQLLAAAGTHAQAGTSYAPPASYQNRQGADHHRGRRGGDPGRGGSVEAAGALLAEDPSPPLDSPRAPTLAVGAVSSASPRSGRR